MWEIMQKHMPVDDEMLLEKMHEIDLRDGYEDGKLNKNVVRQCRSCGRTLNKHHTKCLYCGSRDLAGDPFDTVK